MHVTRDRRWFWGGLICTGFVGLEVLTGDYAWAIVTAPFALYLLLD